MRTSVKFLIIFNVFFILLFVGNGCSNFRLPFSALRNSSSSISYGPTSISAVWANNGEDKITQDEMRATQNPSSVINSLWDGTTVKVFGARNEVVAFNLILEAGSQQASGVAVSLSSLTGPNGSVLRSQPRTKENLFNWTGTECELFYVRYLQIKGLSYFGYGNYFEAQVPIMLQRPNGTGGWFDRPNHDKYYPDIAVPLEVIPKFNISQGNNQSIWADIYIPVTAAPGTYSGVVSVFENDMITRKIPVSLIVRNFALPDSPNSKTMVFADYASVGLRYTGVWLPAVGTAENLLTENALSNQRLLAHRHKISLIGDDGTQLADQDHPSANYMPVLNGSFFTSANGYAGPGVGVGNDVYSIGTYGSWQTGTWTATQSSMWQHTNNWETWFSTNSPLTTRFVYLIDESLNYAQTETWAKWIATNPGIGKGILSFATANLIDASTKLPSLNITASTGYVGLPAPAQAAVDSYHAQPGKQFFMYNGTRPGSGSFITEDDGVALRELPWGQYKKGISRWFYWQATYYYNDQGGGHGNTDVFNTATTFGSLRTTLDPNTGMQGPTASNGDGILLYPGTDAQFPGSSYGIAGPIASLRLKHWRRGIQDVDYLALAKGINPAAVNGIIQQMLPEALWETGCGDNTCTWVSKGPSWSTNPDDWEKARAALAHIIDGQ